MRVIENMAMMVDETVSGERGDRESDEGETW